MIEASAGEPLSVRALCAASEVSERSLEYAFLHAYGVTPRTFLKARRLHGVRRGLIAAAPGRGLIAAAPGRGLIAAAPGARVVDVANDWGFWHLGQLAADYRRQFGELPSATLARIRPDFEKHDSFGVPAPS